MQVHVTSIYSFLPNTRQLRSNSCNERSVPLAACMGYLITLYTLPSRALLFLSYFSISSDFFFHLCFFSVFICMFLLYVILLLVSLTGDNSNQLLLSFRYGGLTGYIRACFTAHGRPCTQSLRKMV